jgi:zinc protease
VAVRLQAKRETLPAGLTILGEVLRQPGFPESEFEILKRETLDGLKQQKTEPQTLAVTALRRRLAEYPATDVRYVPTVDENIARTEAVTLAEVKELYETMLGAAAGELAAVGDFDPDATTAQFNGFLKGWAAKVPYKRIASPAKPTAGGRESILTPDKANAFYVAGIGFPMTDADPDYAAMEIGNYVLGAAPLASRLSNRVRGKDGLSYGVMSMVQASALDEAGIFLAFAIANPVNMAKVDAAIEEEVKKFLTEGVSATELEEAKKGYLQNRQVGRSTDSGLASQLATNLHAGRTMAYETEFEKRVSAAQPGDVKAAFDKRLDPKKLAVIQAGDFNKKEAPKEPEKKDDKK